MYTQRIRVDDLQSERGEVDGPTAYARAKRAQVILTEMWAKRLEDRGVVVHAMLRTREQVRIRLPQRLL